MKLPSPALLLALTVMSGVARAALVTNGGFEEPDSSVDIFHGSIPGWSKIGSSLFEIQPNAIFQSAEGNQHIELDGTSSYSIFQTLNTTPGTRYELSFAFAARPGRDASQNVLGVYWDNVHIATLIADGTSSGPVPEWTYFTYLLEAPSVSTVVMFSDLGISESHGTLLDDVRVTAVPEPNHFVVWFALSVISFAGARWRPRAYVASHKRNAM